MNYAEALDWLYQAQVFGIKLGLEHPRRLLAALGQPQEKLRFVHVAGTNGKGSVCAFLASILQVAGQRTGRFTSPHLIDFRERMTLNGEMISREDVAAGLSRLREITQDWPDAPTFFELTTALAIDWFAREGAEWVVLETGMGGRLDATNVVTPELCLLTPVSYDHQAWLGETLTAIAGEKAGIMKPGISAISLPQTREAEAVFRQAAELRPCSLDWVEEPWTETELPLIGAHQQWNAALAVAAAEKILPGISGEIVRRGLAATRWPARFEALGDRLILDGAHNPASVAELVRTWRWRFGEERPVVIFGALQDKPFESLLRLLREIAAQFWFVPLRSPRAVSPEVLRAALVGEGEPRVFTKLEDALVEAETSGHRVLVCGSLFLAGEVLAWWQKMEEPRTSVQ
jgi:dihydrofolate synthase/folylpolyglutamate synthase